MANNKKGISNEVKKILERRKKKNRGINTLNEAPTSNIIKNPNPVRNNINRNINRKNKLVNDIVNEPIDSFELKVLIFLNKNNEIVSMDINSIRKLLAKKLPMIDNISDREIYDSLTQFNPEKRLKYVSMGLLPMVINNLTRIYNILDCHHTEDNGLFRQFTDSFDNIHLGNGRGFYPAGPMFMYSAEEGFCCDAIVSANPSVNFEYLEIMGYKCHGSKVGAECPMLYETEEGLVVEGGCSWGGTDNTGYWLYEDTSCCFGCPTINGIEPCPDTEDNFLNPKLNNWETAENYSEIVFGDSDVLQPTFLCSKFDSSDSICNQWSNLGDDGFLNCITNGCNWDNSNQECNSFIDNYVQQCQDYYNYMKIAVTESTGNDEYNLCKDYCMAGGECDYPDCLGCSCEKEEVIEIRCGDINTFQECFNIAGCVWDNEMCYFKDDIEMVNNRGYKKSEYECKFYQGKQACENAEKCIWLEEFNICKVLSLTDTYR